jgi:Skp family chaperone for outer membrane proteins
VKKTVLCTAAVLAVAMTYVASRLAAQTGTTQTASAPTAAVSTGRGTRVAVMNLAYVIKNYDKFKAFETEMKANLKQFDDKLSGKRSQLEAMTKEAQAPATTPARKEELERNARSLQREVEDVNNDAKAFITKKRDDQIVQLYREVQDAAQRYALSNGIDLVLHYTDATTEGEYYHPGNVARKMQSPGCMPLYINHAAGADISREVAMSLNAAYAPGGRPAAPTAGGATGSQR